MKRVVLIMVAALCGVVCAQAQFRYGLSIGGEISTARPGGMSAFSLRHGSGFRGGLTCEYMLNEAGGVAFGASVLYSHGGAMEVVGGAGSGDVRKLGNDFLEVPLRVEYKYFFKGMRELAGVLVYTGPSLRVRLDGDAANVPVGSRRLQPGWDVGVGLDVINFLQVSAGYRFGLGNALHPGVATMRADGVQVSVTWLFDI